jgi:hypothetical protein
LIVFIGPDVLEPVYTPPTKSTQKHPYWIHGCPAPRSLYQRIHSNVKLFG